jgi:hypothetical protein
MRSTAFAMRGLCALLGAAAAVTAQGTIEIEPNDAPPSATPLLAGAQAYGELTTGALDDWDYYAIALSAPADLLAWTGPGFVNQAGDTRLALTDAAGNVLVEIDDGNTATHGYYSVLTFGGLPAGNYCLRVRGYDPTTLGTYTLDVVTAPRGTYAPDVTLTPISEGQEPNDPRVASGVTTPSTPFSHNRGSLSGGGTAGTGFAIAGADYDFFRFTVTTPGLHTLSTLGTALLTTTPLVDDTVVFLVQPTNPGYAVLAFNDDFQGSSYSQLVHDIVTPGVYYAVVKGYSGSSSGQYALDVTGPTPPLPTGTATFVRHPGGCPGQIGMPTLGVRPATFGFTVAPEKPILGSTWAVDVTNVPSGAALVRLIGLVPTPIDLAPFGAPGCVVEIADVQELRFADPAGFHWWTMTLPVDLQFVGVQIQQQIAVLDALANQAGVSVAARVSFVAGISH